MHAKIKPESFKKNHNKHFTHAHELCFRVNKKFLPQRVNNTSNKEVL